MKNILKVMAIAIIITTFISCRKNKTKYTISGNIYYNCDKVGLANRNFVLLQNGIGGGIIDSFKTDAAGHFSVEYAPLISTEVILAQRQRIGVGEYGVFVPYRNYHQVQLYGERTCNLHVRLQVTGNNYTNRDTLYISDYRSNVYPFEMAIPGPFTSKSLYTINNYSLALATIDSAAFTFRQRINGGATSEKTILFKICDNVEYVAEVR